MTDKDIPLSVSHKTFWNSLATNQRKLLSLVETIMNKIQSCTVDVAEHERIVADLYESYEDVLNKVSENHGKELLYVCKQNQKIGYDEALRRVREAIEKQKKLWRNGGTDSQQYGNHCVKIALIVIEKELFGEEKQP